MYLCYIDESGTPELPGNSTHFVLAGFALPIWHWKAADREISSIMARHDLSNAEIHTAWMLRQYPEQDKIPNFENLDHDARRFAVRQIRNSHLLTAQKSKTNKIYNQALKNFRKTDAYIHLTKSERISVVREVADCIGGWGFARLFAECIDKIFFDPSKTGRTIEQQAFEQIVSRYEQALVRITGSASQRVFGILVHDNNQTVELKHTQLMRDFHNKGTLWTSINHIIETPMFVNSSLTRMVQIADLCSYALRRFCEYKETDLFNRVFQRADRIGKFAVGVRHYSAMNCTCLICVNHN